MAPSRDVARFERGFSEERLLLREFTHRINNDFASAIGAISVAAARSANGEVKSTLRAVEDRLHHYVQVHRALQMPQHAACVDVGAYLRGVCRAISRAKLDHEGIELVLVEHDVLLDSERCWLLGLIVSELVTNSARHGFRGGNGTIRVELLLAEPFIRCKVTDDGEAQTPVQPGRGLEIAGELARSLGGRIDRYFGPHGATAVLIFPAD